LETQITQERDDLLAKDQEISRLLARSDEISAKKEDLESKIAAMREKLSKHQWKGKIASRHERIVKASYRREGATKYGNVRYTMYAPPKKALK
jgi:small-conductance mechanosensitive channel